MKLINKLTVIATLGTFMFAGMNLTWGNAYSNDADDLAVANQFGVWLDVNDSMAFGWEGSGIKVGFDGPAGMQARMGYDTAAGAGTTVGMSRTWWTSTGDGWGTNLSTALDFNMTGGAGGTAAGDWTLTMNLGFGF